MTNKQKIPAPSTDAVVTTEIAQQAFQEARDGDSLNAIAKELVEREPELAELFEVYSPYAVGSAARFAGGLSEDAVAAVVGEVRRATLLVYRALTVGYRAVLDQECPPLAIEPDTEEEAA